MSDVAFLLGVPRSGTTLLASLLNQHPHLHCPAEPWLLLALNEFGRVHPAASCGPRLLQQALADFLPEPDRDRLLADCAAMAYRSRAEAAGRRIFIDKTPRYYQILDRLDAWFPDAPRLVIVRHPLDVAVSMIESWKVDLADVVSKRSDHRLAIDYCLGHERIAGLVAAPGPRTVVIRYEELIADPARALAPVWNVLGVASAPIDAAQPSGEGNPATTGSMGDSKIRTAGGIHARSIGQWRTHLDADAIRILAGVLGHQIFSRLGYDRDLAGFAWPAAGDTIATYAAFAGARAHASRQPADEVTPMELDRLMELRRPSITFLLRLAFRRLRLSATELTDFIRSIPGTRRDPTRLRWLRRLVAPRLGVLQQYSPRQLPRSWPRPRPAVPASGWPMISIVTPSFRQGQFIARTLDSVLEQGYSNLEYIVQDGGSSDGTIEVLKRYAPRLASWESARDEGQSEALNRGFARSHGEIMAYLNSDDLLLPGALHCIAGYFAAHPEVDAIYGHRVIIDEEDREIGRWVLPRHDPEVLRYVDYVPQETLFWRRSAWERAGGRIDASFRFAMDWDLLLRLQSANAHIVRLPWFLGAFRVHARQKTSSIINGVGAEEIGRLRRREFGRVPDQAEIDAIVKPYVRRALLDHLLHRMGIRC